MRNAFLYTQMWYKRRKAEILTLPEEVVEALATDDS
jgi:hypothetical protein